MCRKFFLFLSLLIPLLVEASLPAPEFRCVRLLENDDVTLYWTNPFNNGEFISYTVYYQPSPTADFTLIDSITDPTIDSVALIGSFTGASSFYLRTYFDEGSGTIERSATSDTVSPILLSATQDSDDWTILSWNLLDLASDDPTHRMYRRLLGGSWELVDSADYPQDSLLDTPGVCQATLQYKLKISGTGGCHSSSNVAQVDFENVPPPPLNLICASVDTSTGYVWLEWEPSQAEDLFGYRLTRYADFQQSEEHFDTSNLSFLYTTNGVNAQIAPDTFAVQPFDNCIDPDNGKYYAPNTLLRFSTLYGQLIGMDKCAGEVTLLWNHPTNDNPVGVRNTAEYRIYSKDEDGNIQLRGVLSPQDSVFVDTGVVIGKNYTYVVTAYNAMHDKEALSNKIEVSFSVPNRPQYLYVSCVSNDHSSDRNILNIQVDDHADILDYALLRAMTKEGPYQRINTIDRPNRTDFTITDDYPLGDQGAFYYIVAGLDDCGSIIMTSDTVRNVRLGGFINNTDLTVTLEWNAYEGFDSASTFVGDYQLIRQISSTGEEFIYSSSEPSNFRDDISPLEEIGSNICYYVEVMESEVNRWGGMETCLSNLLCFPQEPTVFIPNAFSPDNDQINDVFLPYINYVDAGAYQLDIFDRSGSLVFSTSDQSEGWNGNGFGMGVYAYRLEILNVREELDVYTGVVALIR